MPAPGDPLQAITFDFWDTLYDGASDPARRQRRLSAFKAMLRALGREIADDALSELYRTAGAEADRWWREERRGYTANERIRWILARLDIVRPDDCAHVAAVCAAVDDALLELPPPLLPGAGDAVRRLAARCPLAIVSDTGFASGDAQNALLERDGLRGCFAATIYSADLGHAKPRPEPFAAAVSALGIPAGAILHVGDNERTDIRGALDAGLRAARLDLVRESGPSAAEVVARGFAELVDYVERTAGGGRGSRAGAAFTA